MTQSLAKQPVFAWIAISQSVLPRLKSLVVTGWETNADGARKAATRETDPIAWLVCITVSSFSRTLLCLQPGGVNRFASLNLARNVQLTWQGDSGFGRMVNPRQSAAVDTVSRYGWLATCPAEFRDWLLAAMRWQFFSAGDGVMHGGDTDGGVYCVGDGQVSFVSGLGMPDIGTSHFGLPGNWWGHAPLIGFPRVGSVIASTDTLCGMIPRALLRGHLTANPALWEQITIGVTGLWFLSIGAHSDLLIPDSLRRVSATILRLGGQRHQLFPIAQPASIVCTQDMLAGATALSRNTVGKLVRKLEADGLIDARYGRLAILDSRGLHALANES